MNIYFHLCLFLSGLITILHLISAELYVDSPCKNGDDSGTCTMDCPQANEAVEKYRYHNFTRCGFENFTEIICCPTTSLRANLGQARKSEKLCDIYYKNVSVKVIHYQISEGKNAEAEEFPHMAVLGRYSQQDKVYSFDCGGSLISEKFVLTAAHCTSSRIDKKELKLVRMGVIDVPKTIEKIDSVLDFEIKKIHVHPNYISKSRYNDIALLELKRSVVFSDAIRPACLHQVDTLPEDFLIIGWGEVNVSQARTNILQKATVELLNTQECEQSLTRLSTVSLRSSQICATDEKSNTCQGDSGGPLQQLDTRYPVIVGVTSYGGNICGDNIPTVYTNVEKYLDWIEGIVWPGAT